MTRDDVLKAWPRATWMPWDEPPIGTRVRGAVNAHFRGIVAGKHSAPGSPFDGYWIVDTSLVAPREFGGYPITALAYPPELIPDS
jgi:hypothetical protein